MNTSTAFWSLLTDGMFCVAGKELLLLVDAHPLDALRLFLHVYVMALKGHRYLDMDVAVFAQLHAAYEQMCAMATGARAAVGQSSHRPLFDDQFAACLFVTPSPAQCLHSMPTPVDGTPYLLCTLVKADELPLAMTVPVRLLLRLGHLANGVICLFVL